MIALVIAALQVGQEVFVPVALAILLRFVLAPLIRLLSWLRAIGLDDLPKNRKPPRHPVPARPQQT